MPFGISSRLRKIEDENAECVALSSIHVFVRFKRHLDWYIWYVIGILESKYCNGFSHQLQLKICLKQLFRVTFFFLLYFHRSLHSHYH